jgi:hypothetical protein
MTSHAERKRRKGRARAKVSMPGSEAIPQVHPNDPRRERAEDARKTALEARVRVFGATDTPEGRRASSEPLWGCSVGRALLAEPDTHRADLWNAAYHARKTQLAHDRAIGAPNRHATCLRILAPVAAFEADASSPAPDFRTEEDRARQATSAQMRVEMWIGHTDARAVSAFKQAVINDPDGPIRDWQGVLNCLWCIVEGLKGDTVKARVRK